MIGIRLADVLIVAADALCSVVISQISLDFCPSWLKAL